MVLLIIKLSENSIEKHDFVSHNPWHSNVTQILTYAYVYDIVNDGIIKWSHVNSIRYFGAVLQLFWRYIQILPFSSKNDLFDLKNGKNVAF